MLPVPCDEERKEMKVDLPSRKIISVAAVKVMPRPPARVESKKTLTLDAGSWKRRIPRFLKGNHLA